MCLFRHIIWKSIFFGVGGVVVAAVVAVGGGSSGVVGYRNCVGQATAC